MKFRFKLAGGLVALTLVLSVMALVHRLVCAIYGGKDSPYNVTRVIGEKP